MSASNETHEYSGEPHEEAPEETQRMGHEDSDKLLEVAKSEASRKFVARTKYSPANDGSINGPINGALNGQAKNLGQISLPSEAAFIEKGSDDSDESLFWRYQQGDQQAFLRVYERYKSNIYAYCARALLTAGFDTNHIEDTFQEVFLRVAQYQHTFTGGDFRAWIFTVTRHTCLITKKKGIRYRLSTEQVGDPESMDDDVGMDVRKAFSITDDPLERMSQREQTDLLLRAIEALPETYREALLLSEYEGLTYDEIGKLTGTSLSTIRIRIFRAKARLRKALLPIIGDQVDNNQATSDL